MSQFIRVRVVVLLPRANEGIRQLIVVSERLYIIFYSELFFLCNSYVIRPKLVKLSYNILKKPEKKYATLGKLLSELRFSNKIYIFFNKTTILQPRPVD